ncbi:hypothetical protein ACIPN8_37440 [Streptomyces sp. NPDC086082]|uniref:hypothetical protein n=1 Tax=Streptomyces sp. NPDC086082 TaxID=3365750 RepID=UPI003801D244
MSLSPSSPGRDADTRPWKPLASTSGATHPSSGCRISSATSAAPLRIDGTRGHWEEIEELWLAGDLTDDEFEDHFVDDVIVEDIGEGTDGWEFPGASYTVEVR